MIKHFSFTCLEVVFFPRLSKGFNHEGLSMFYIRGVASKIHPDSFRKWKSFLLITYLPPSTLHFGEKIIFAGGKRTINAFTCYTTCLIQHHFTILVANGKGDSFWLCSCIINASALIWVQTLRLIDLGVEQSVVI